LTPDAAPSLWLSIWLPYSLAFVGRRSAAPPAVLDIKHGHAVTVLWPKGQWVNVRIFLKESMHYWISKEHSVFSFSKSYILSKSFCPQEESIEEDKQVFFQFYLTVCKHTSKQTKINSMKELFCSFLVEMIDCLFALNSLEVKGLVIWYISSIVLWAVKFYGYTCKTTLSQFMSNWKVYFSTNVPVEIQAIYKKKSSKIIKQISLKNKPKKENTKKNTFCLKEIYSRYIHMQNKNSIKLRVNP
jgi:hypothetical protein